MAEGIEFLIDIEAKLDGAVAATGAMRKFIDAGEKADKAAGHAAHSVHALSDASDKATHAHGRHSAGLINLGHQFEYAKNGVNEFLEALGLILVFEGLEKLVDKVKELGMEVLNTAAKAERMKLGFDTSFGKEKSRELLEFLEKFSKESEFTLEQSKGFALELSRAGFSADKIPRAMRAASDLAVRAGTGVEGMEAALSGLERLNAGGTLGKREFLRMGLGIENAPEKYFAELSKRVGKGVVQVKKDMEAGKVPIEDAREALYTLIAGEGGIIGPKGQEAGKTLGAKIAHFGEIPDKLFEGVEGSAGYEKLKGVLNDVSKRLDPNTPVGQKLVENLSLGLSAFADALAKIDMEKFSKSVIDLFTKLPPLIGATTDAIIKLASVIPKIPGFGHGAVVSEKEKVDLGAFGSGAGISKNTATGLQAKTIDFEGLDPSVKRLADAKGFWGKMSAIFFDGGTNTTDGYAAGVDAGAPKMAKSVDKSIKGAIDAGANAQESHSPSRKFMQLGEWSAQGYEEGLTKTPPSIATRGYMADALSVSPPSIGAGSLLSGMQPGGMTPRNVTVSAPINVSVSGSDATPEAIAEAIEMRVPSAILSALEQMALEGGQD